MDLTLEPQRIFVVLATILDTVAILRALWRTQGVERTLMWFFSILAFPMVGALAYFILANPSVRRTSKRKRDTASQFPDNRDAGKRLGGLSLTHPILSLAAAVTSHLPTTGNRISMLPEAPLNFPLLEQLILKAEKSVWVEFYIIHADETGRRFLSLLAEAAGRGLEVRLLYDAVGSLGIDNVYLEKIERAGGKVEAFHPLGPWRRRWSVHLRNHRKLIIIDGQKIISGSMNVGNEYSWKFLKRKTDRFRDVNLMIEGPAAGDFSHVFAEDWLFATEEYLDIPLSAPKKDGAGSVAIMPSGPDQTLNASALLYFGAINTAKKRLFITTPYFIPDEPISRGLQVAALGGVDVRLIVPAKVDAALVGPAGRCHYPALLEAGVKIYEYLPSMLHAKTMVVDDTLSLVGSANLDIRSLKLNFELGVLVEDGALNSTLAQRFLEDQAKSRQVTHATLDERSYTDQAVERLARLLSPVL